MDGWMDVRCSAEMSSMGQIGLSKASVLYIGSAVPLETAVGIESIQMPCRERYVAAVGPDMKVAGIDATLTVYSSGITLQVLTSLVTMTTSAPACLDSCSRERGREKEGHVIVDNNGRGNGNF